MLKLIIVTAASLLGASLVYAAADLTITIIPPNTNANASTALLGLYQGQGTSPVFHTWAGRYPDFVINWAFMSPDGGSDPSNNGGDPVILSMNSMGTNTCTDVNAAASGACDNDYRTVVSNLMVPYASHIYAIRINTEWPQGSDTGYAPFDSACNVKFASTPWSQGIQHLINVIRSYPALSQVKIEMDAPQSVVQQAYWPGDSYVDLTGFDRYWFSQYEGSDSHVAWNNAQTRHDPCSININTAAAWGAAHGKALIISEWCDTYGDGFIIDQFSAWMKTNNVVAQTYWDSNDAISSPLGCKLLDQSARQTAYFNAFGGSAYTGSYWTLKPQATGGY
jgi:hypothetical protein